MSPAAAPLVSLLVALGPTPSEHATPAEPAPVVAAIERDASPNVVVEVQSCEGLDAAEVARVLDLELRSVTTEIRTGPPLAVTLHCAERLTITVEDPITQKALRREVPAPPTEPGRERIVALAVSELFHASWLELLTTPIPTVEPEAGAEPVVTPPAPAIEAALKVAERRTRPPRGIEVLVGGGARGRSLETSERFAALRVDATVRGWLGESVGLQGQVGWDYGQSARTFGRVRGDVIGAAAGLAWRVRARPVVGLGGSVLVGAAWARLAGRSDASGVPTGRTSGATGELSASAGPRITYGRLRVDLDGELGLMLRSPLGVVNGEAPVSMGGLWVGAALRLGLDVRPLAPRASRKTASER